MASEQATVTSHVNGFPPDQGTSENYYYYCYYYYYKRVECAIYRGCVSCAKLLDVDPQDQAEEEGANIDLDSQRKGKCAVIKTSTRQVSRATYHSDRTGGGAV